MHIYSHENFISVCNYLFSWRFFSDAMQPQCNLEAFISNKALWQCYTTTHYTMSYLTHHHSPPFQYSSFCIFYNICTELLPWNHLILLPPKSCSSLWSSPSAICWWGIALLPTRQCLALQYPQRATNRNGWIEGKGKKKKKRTKSSYMKDKNEEDEKIKRQINQVKREWQR